jgi:hypothetical protein
MAAITPQATRIFFTSIAPTPFLMNDPARKSYEQHLAF